jgi:hypothetical protein
MAACAGNGADHCCYVNGQPCRFLEVGTVKGRRWACGLRRRLGSWARVHADPGYVRHVQPLWTRDGGRMGCHSCGEWPGAGNTCATCGVTGHG